MSIQDAYISNRCVEIDSLIKDCKKWAVGDARLGAHLATYINVLILGALEECVKYLVRERSKKTGDVGVEKYMAKAIKDGFRNPDYGKICGLLGQFSDRYKIEFQGQFGSDSLERDALESLIANKTNIAHKGIANLGLSIRDVEIHFQRVKKVVEKLEDLLIINP